MQVNMQDDGHHSCVDNCRCSKGILNEGLAIQLISLSKKSLFSVTTKRDILGKISSLVPIPKENYPHFCKFRVFHLC